MEFLIHSCDLGALSRAAPFAPLTWLRCRWVGLKCYPSVDTSQLQAASLPSPSIGSEGKGYGICCPCPCITLPDFHLRASVVL